MRMLGIALCIFTVMLFAACGKGKGGSNPPAANLSASATSGSTPLQVDFDASLSMDPDGDLLSYEWDFDGNGVMDVSTGTVATTSHVYTTAGSPNATVRVSDPQGNMASASFALNITAGSLDAPVGTITPDKAAGDAPLEVSFSVTATSPQFISQIEIDYEGDGSFDAFASSLEQANGGMLSHVYAAPGRYNPVLRLGNLLGEVSEFSSIVAVADNGNAPPSVSLGVDSSSGAAPLAVSFTAAAADPGGSIAEVEWDFDGDAVFEQSSGTSVTAAHTYGNGGAFMAEVRVTDNGGLTARAKTLVTVSRGGNTPPLAELEADKRGGDVVPVDITLDASASTDAEGPIKLYEWDLDGDGVYDEQSSSPTLTYACAWKGETRPRVRVTDADGATAEVSLSGDPVFLDRGWTVSTISVSQLVPTEITTAGLVTDGSTLIVAAYQQDSKIYYMGANANTPTSWSSPVHVTSGVTAPCSKPRLAMQLSSQSAFLRSITYIQEGVSSPGVYIVRPKTATGTSWNAGSRVTTNAPIDLSAHQTVLIGSSIHDSVAVQGLTAIGYRRSTPAAPVGGSFWTNELAVYKSTTSKPEKLILHKISNSPAIAIAASQEDLSGSFSRICYVRASDSGGDAWPPVSVVETSCRASGPIAMAEVADAPAIVYVPSHASDTANRGCQYERSSAASGWTEGQKKKFPVGSYAKYVSMGVRQDRPWVVFATEDNKIRAVRATNAVGSTWSAVEIVDSPGGTIRAMSMSIVGGKPIIVYSSDVPNPLIPSMIFQRQIKVAVWD